MIWHDWARPARLERLERLACLGTPGMIWHAWHAGIIAVVSHVSRGTHTPFGRLPQPGCGGRGDPADLRDRHAPHALTPSSWLIVKAVRSCAMQALRRCRALPCIAVHCRALPYDIGAIRAIIVRNPHSKKTGALLAASSAP